MSPEQVTQVLRAAGYVAFVVAVEGDTTTVQVFDSRARRVLGNVHVGASIRVAMVRREHQEHVVSVLSEPAQVQVAS